MADKELWEKNAELRTLRSKPAGAPARSRNRKRNKVVGLKCTLMHKRIPVADIELDDATGFIQKVGKLYAPDRASRTADQNAESERGR